jgi:uncharacterized membrane protein (DUF485 family)
MSDPSSSTSDRSNSRLGLYLFFLYSVVYLAFALTSAFSPKLSQLQLFGGVNLATWWGLGLIGLAFVLSMIYGVSCKTDPVKQRSSEEDR